MARRLFLVLLLGGTTACDRPVPARSNDTAVIIVPPPDSAPPIPTSTASPWDSAAGAVFLVVGPNARQAMVVVPAIDTAASLDTISINLDVRRFGPFDLFVAGSRIGTGTLGEPLDADIPDDCTAWPLVRLGGPDSTPGSWTVGFGADRFQPLRVDSLAALARPDSSRLAVELARAASAAPGDTIEALRGVPFVVRRAWRVRVPPARTMVMAEVERSLNQEANQTQEHLLLVVERDSTARQFDLAYAERSGGGEESLESDELLAIGTLRGREQPVALIARYVGDGVIYALLERQADGRWRLRWSSPYTGC